MFTRAQFIEIVAPLAQKDMQKSNVLASLTIAQAILESNNGNSGLTRQGNALFGIKATGSWKGKVWTGNTIEYWDRKTATSTVAAFRAYSSWGESIADHSKLITFNARYIKVVGEKDYKKACKYIHQAGYATDPNYAEKLISLIERNDLTKYDIVEDKELSGAVSKIIKKGINIQFNKWKRKDLISLKDVPALLNKLGGLDYLINNKVITEEEVWRDKRYTADNVRSLLIKFASI